MILCDLTFKKRSARTVSLKRLCVRLIWFGCFLVQYTNCTMQSRIRPQDGAVSPRIWNCPERAKLVDWLIHSTFDASGISSHSYTTKLCVCLRNSTVRSILYKTNRQNLNNVPNHSLHQMCVLSCTGKKRRLRLIYATQLYWKSWSDINLQTRKRELFEHKVFSFGTKMTEKNWERGLSPKDSTSSGRCIF